jgi:hypothetical protein
MRGGAVKIVLIPVGGNTLEGANPMRGYALATV